MVILYLYTYNLFIHTIIYYVLCNNHFMYHATCQDDKAKHVYLIRESLSHTNRVALFQFLYATCPQPTSSIVAT